MMQCPCGGATTDHKVQENKQVVAEYAKCHACGRVCWIYDNRSVRRIEENEDGAV